MGKLLEQHKSGFFSRFLNHQEGKEENAVFGVPLNVLMERQKKEDPKMLIPKVVKFLAEAILKQKGLSFIYLFIRPFVHSSIHPLFF